MASLLQQLQHVLQPWDGLGDPERGTSVARACDKAGESRGDAPKNSFHSLADSRPTAGGAGGRCARVPATSNSAAWGADMQSAGDGGELSVPLRQPTTLISEAGQMQCREVVTKLELARAALALFTSNAGVYRPVLGKTLGFVFDLVDELLQDNARLRECSAVGQGGRRRLWELGEADAAEVAAVHEKMRVMEAHMAKLVEESSTQRDHLKAEIGACHEREKKLEMLLEHQMMLTHASGLQLDGNTVIGKGLRDADYVRRLIARASKEKALDDLQQELEALMADQEQLRKRTHELLELNGMYARQSIALSTRLSILGDYNIAIAVETQKIRNNFIIEKRKCEKYRLDLVALRNMVMASFSNRNADMQRHWAELRNRRLDKEAEAIMKLSAMPIADNCEGKQKDDVERASPPADLVETEAPSVAGSSRCSSLPPQDKPSSSLPSAFRQGGWRPCGHEPAAAAYQPLHVPGMGCNARVPQHLRTVEAVQVLHIDPVFVERQVCALLWDWRKEGMQEPLDSFAKKFFISFLQTSDEGASTSSEGNTLRDLHEVQKEQLQLAYAFDAVSRADGCGSLTRAYGLVTRKRVNKDVIRMIELDSSMALAIFRFLDMRRNDWKKASGTVPVLEFANVMSAMYPSYPIGTIKELVDAAVGLGGNSTEFPGYVCYDVLFPERLFLDSEAMVVENSGAPPHSGFLRLFHYFILGDVEDSWLRIEDSFASLQSLTGLVAEQMLMYQGFNELPEGPAIIWTPALRAVLSSWEVLRLNRGPLDLIDVVYVSLSSALEFLRVSAVPRRGTHPMRNSPHEVYLKDLYKQLKEANPQLGRGAPHAYYASLVRHLDPVRHAVWGPQNVSAGDSLRYMSHEESLTTTSLLERLVEKHRNREGSSSNLLLDGALAAGTVEAVAQDC